jgi:predicted ribosome quality control (RQC) complex YloA/Tae2 family protein
LKRPDSKAVILIESGIRIHGTSFDWPKNMVPSGFSMKLRKHLRGRRLENVEQLGGDRIVDLQFGSNEAAYHLIVELYDRGNILLTDHEFIIIAVLRPRTDNENTDVKFVVREEYPRHLAKQIEKPTLERLTEIFSNSKDNDDIRKYLTSNFSYGGPLIDHCLSIIPNLNGKTIIGKTFDIKNDLNALLDALLEAEKIMNETSSGTSKGFIIQKKSEAVKLLKDGKSIENEGILT